MNEFLWQNGQEVARFEISTPKDPSAAGLWLGDGLFETMLALKGKIFARKRHIARFKSSAQEVQIDLQEFERGLDEALLWLDGRIGRIRLTQTSAGDVFIFAREHEVSNSWAKVVLFPSPMQYIEGHSVKKTLSYGVNGQALRFAREKGADDALFFNHHGEITESSLANLLTWDGSHWWTPPLNSPSLPGVTRELLIEYFGVKEAVIKIEDLPQMKGLALTSSLRGVQPVSEFEGSSYRNLSEVDRLRQDFANWRDQNLNP